MNSADERRMKMIRCLEESDQPIKGYELSSLFGVSRQVIVKDISYLKTQNYSIFSSSKGYYMNPEPQGKPYKRIIMCQHEKWEIEEELTTIIENGAMIDNVSVEHPVYGTLQAELMIETMTHVRTFVDNMNKYQGTMLAKLTDMIHLHTISADSEKMLDNAIKDLEDKGFLVDIEEKNK
ncbi:transcription repressor NadR [Staphylococcus felis]|uniref:Transcription repressor NadR n=1 Tax=Staphylococcus felis TaxID=46127 RepID=A0A2K3ZFC4_9STAP|nr:transcription repressor NadR [Staphylococcus felis]AVP35990.1 transcription repressor NadR [Staphylococcus felis]PNZ36144.1 transcription repressor NadR [Staphylococcus felis]QQB04038.1 transcription repressor NadR [Staphylococcus felis]REH75128.1 transcription repressor NadR [Staphylococcus felis]REH76272.1 transcription repressor NadR [Staphylococcus felis]